MRKQELFRWVLMVVFALSTIGISGVALAQDDDDVEEQDSSLLVEIEGEVEVLEDDLIVIGGLTVAPAGAFIPALLDVGDVVILEGYLLDDDTVWAISLEVVEEASEDDTEPAEDEDDLEDPDDDMEDEDADDDACLRDDHPVILAMVETYGGEESLGVTYEQLRDLHCEGHGLGNIIKVLEAAERVGLDELLEGEEGEPVEGLTFDAMWELYLEAGNPGQFKKMLAEEYGIHPSELAPGQAIGKGKPDRDKAGDDDDDDDEPGPPPHAGPPGDDREPGPPAHAGPPGGDGPPGLSRDDGPPGKSKRK